MLLNMTQKNKIAEENESLVYYVVKKFQTCGVAYDELVSISFVGYAKALNAFDDSRGVKFSTYAINCIRNEILFFLRKEKTHMRNNVSFGTVLSIDKNGNNLSLEEIIGNEIVDGNSLEDEIVLADDVRLVKEAMKQLSPKEQLIVTYRFGLDRGIVSTQKDIASQVGMSQANISKIEKSVIDKLRNILKTSYKWDC